MFNKYDLLIIGSLPHEGKPQTFGGTTILMQNFFNYAQTDNQCDIRLIKLNRFNFKGANLFNIVYVFFNVIIFVPLSKKIMFNASSNGAFYVAPFVFLYSKLFSKIYIFRMFGGNLLDLLKSKPKITTNFFIKTVMNSDLFLVETKQIMNYIKKYNKNTLWFPNVRSVTNFGDFDRSYSKRFVFISHVKKSKGILEIINAFKLLDNSFIVDVYGPIKDDVLELIVLPNNFNYKGALHPDEVLETLNSYDVLLLPTFHEGEGYPGIIIEAYSQGLPVVTTNWKSIPEIIDNNSGILISPKSSVELFEAIKVFNKTNYPDFSKSARKKYTNFDSKFVNRNILNMINNL